MKKKIDFESIDIKLQDHHLEVRSNLEDIFQKFGIEIQDMYIDNKLVIRQGGEVLYIPDGQKYRVQIKIANTDLVFLTGPIEPHKDAIKEKWYVIKKPDHIVGMWTDCFPFVYSGKLLHCIRELSSAK